MWSKRLRAGMKNNSILNLDYIYEKNRFNYSFVAIPTKLIIGEEFKELDYGSKLLYGLLLSRVSISFQNREDFVDEATKRVFIKYSYTDISNKLGCSKSSAGKYLMMLEKYGLIEIEKVKSKGWETKIYVKDFSKKLGEDKEEAEESNPENEESTVTGLDDENITEKENPEEESQGEDMNNESDMHNYSNDMHKQCDPPVLNFSTPCSKVYYSPVVKFTTGRYTQRYIDNIDRLDRSSISKEYNNKYKIYGIRQNIWLSDDEYTSIIHDYSKRRACKLLDICSDKIFARKSNAGKITSYYSYIKKIAENMGFKTIKELTDEIIITDEMLDKYYYEIRKKAKEKAKKNHKEVTESKGFKAVKNEINKLYIQKIKNRGDPNKLHEIDEKLSRLEKELEEILKKSVGYNPDLREIWKCKKCKDTGYVGRDGCTCREERKEELRKKILERKITNST